MNNLDKIVKLLPLAAVIVIGLGVLKTSVYYNNFGVDIMSYLTTTEVLTLFLNDLQPLLVLIIVAFVHITISKRFFESIENSMGSDVFEKFIRDKKWFYFTFFLIVFICLSCSIGFHILKLSNLFIYVYVFILIQLVVFSFVRKEGDTLIKNEFLLKVFVVICVFLIIPLMSLKDIRMVENNVGQNIQLTIKEDINVNSSKSNRFLGKAGENYFFYNPTKKVTTIYRLEDVKRIEIRK